MGEGDIGGEVREKGIGNSWNPNDGGVWFLWFWVDGV
jgi:hypothetical protein